MADGCDERFSFERAALLFLISGIVLVSVPAKKNSHFYQCPSATYTSLSEVYSVLGCRNPRLIER